MWQDLKNKTKIFVPDSAVVIGVMDETASLQYGQVFLMVDKSPLQDAPQVIKGPIIVAKNPCFHPGDIRVLQALHFIPFLNLIPCQIYAPQQASPLHPLTLGFAEAVIVMRHEYVLLRACPPVTYNES